VPDAKERLIATLQDSLATMSDIAATAIRMEATRTTSAPHQQDNQSTPSGTANLLGVKHDRDGNPIKGGSSKSCKSEPTVVKDEEGEIITSQQQRTLDEWQKGGIFEIDLTDAGTPQGKYKQRPANAKRD